MVIIDKIHPTTISSLGSSKDIGASLGELRYDILLDILRGLHTELLRQRDEDLNRGRLRLSKSLDETASKLGTMLTSLEKVISICRPHIEEEKKLSQ